MLTVLNDLHIGVQRSSGTTPLTQWKLRQSVIAQANELIREVDSDLMILGDLFDTHFVPFHDWLAAWQILDTWLTRHRDRTLYLVAGNHDLSKTSTTIGSFQALGRVLSEKHFNVVVVLEPQEVPHGYIVPHLPNQALFDQALSEVPMHSRALFLHCNYDNNFAVQADQSLNLSADAAEEFTAHGMHIVIGHEHQTRLFGKQIWIPGNQIATSVSDCMGTDVKRKLIINNSQPHFEPVCPVTNLLTRMDWRELAPVITPFIRVEGTAKSDEAADVVARISKYRSGSDALVITNAVKIEVEGGLAEKFAVSLESAKAFDVMAALKQCLTDEEFTIVSELKRKKGAQQ